MKERQECQDRLKGEEGMEEEEEEEGKREGERERERERERGSNHTHQACNFFPPLKFHKETPMAVPIIWTRAFFKWCNYLSSKTNCLSNWPPYQHIPLLRECHQQPRLPLTILLATCMQQLHATCQLQKITLPTKKLPGSRKRERERERERASKGGRVIGQR